VTESIATELLQAFDIDEADEGPTAAGASSRRISINGSDQHLRSTSPINVATGVALTMYARVTPSPQRARSLCECVNHLRRQALFSCEGKDNPSRRSCPLRNWKNISVDSFTGEVLREARRKTARHRHRQGKKVPINVARCDHCARRRRSSRSRNREKGLVPLAHIESVAHAIRSVG
jgi:hypothetical protein